MHTRNGQVFELILRDDARYVRIACLPDLVPGPGQYVLASGARDAPLADPLFLTDSTAGGFIAPAPAGPEWIPGTALFLRGPLGRGFTVPSAARRVALVALAGSPALLQGLIALALKRPAAVVLVSDFAPQDLPDDVEVQPPSALQEVIDWADYVAVDVDRDLLTGWKAGLRGWLSQGAGREAQVLVRTPMPCGGIADCGVCAVPVRSDWKLACRDGPVFDWRDVL